MYIYIHGSQQRGGIFCQLFACMNVNICWHKCPLFGFVAMEIKSLKLILGGNALHFFAAISQFKAMHVLWFHGAQMPGAKPVLGLPL